MSEPSDRYNERLKRARAARLKTLEKKNDDTNHTNTTTNSIIENNVAPVEEEEIKLDVDETDTSCPGSMPVYRNGKWYTVNGEEVKVKKVIRVTWKW